MGAEETEISVSARRVALGVMTSLLGGLVLATALILAARLGWFTELFTHFRVQGAVAGLGLAPLLLLLGARRRALLAFAVGLGHGAAIAPAWLPGAPVPQGLPRFRLLSANLLTENEAHGELLALVREEKPDVVMLVEVGQRWAADLETLADEYPVRRFAPQEDNFGVAALARDRRATVEIVYCGPMGVPSTRVRLPVGDTVVTLLSTHTMPPIGGGAASDRNAQLVECGQVLNREPGPRVLAGDLNVTPWSPAFADLLAATGLLDSRAGFGVQASWLVGFPPLSIPIDHALHSPDLAVLERRIGPEFGSDHRPVIVDFAFSPTLTYNVR